jgi:hypothetical protein
MNKPLELSVMTIPFLLLLSTAKSLSINVGELGKMSEEILRGDRLPLLSFPETDSNSDRSAVD